MCNKILLVTQHIEKCRFPVFRSISSFGQFGGKFRLFRHFLREKRIANQNQYKGILNHQNFFLRLDLHFFYVESAISGHTGEEFTHCDLCSESQILVIMGDGACCPTMDLLRSEPMQLVQLIIPTESAHRAISYLGDLALFQFKDVSQEPFNLF